MVVKPARQLLHSSTNCGTNCSAASALIVVVPTSFEESTVKSTRKSWPVVDLPYRRCLRSKCRNHAGQQEEVSGCERGQQWQWLCCCRG